jgi:hypothetical protein
MTNDRRPACAIAVLTHQIGFGAGKATSLNEYLQKYLEARIWKIEPVPEDI